MRHEGQSAVWGLEMFSSLLWKRTWEVVLSLPPLEVVLSRYKDWEILELSCYQLDHEATTKKEGSQRPGAGALVFALRSLLCWIYYNIMTSLLTSVSVQGSNDLSETMRIYRDERTYSHWIAGKIRF